MTLPIRSARSLTFALIRSAPSSAAPDALRTPLEPGMDVVEVGAHVGEFSMLAATLVRTAGTVFAFEPQRYCAELVKRSAALNGPANVDSSRCVVFDPTGRSAYSIALSRGRVSCA